MTLTLDLAIDLLVAYPNKSFIVGPKSSDLVFGRTLNFTQSKKEEEIFEL